MEKDLMTVAAFDFDGTLTHRDTLPSFLHFFSGTGAAFYKIILETPSLASYVCGMLSRQKTKEAVLTQFFKDIPIEEIRDKGILFANNLLNLKIKPAGLERLRWHLTQGHRCILVSASIDAYLDPWGKQVGFHDVICSKLDFDHERKATGKLLGKNCWGPEKTRRLNELLGPKDRYTLYAYGDSLGDKELLGMADYPFYREWGMVDSA